MSRTIIHPNGLSLYNSADKEVVNLTYGGFATFTGNITANNFDGSSSGGGGGGGSYTHPSNITLTNITITELANISTANITNLNVAGDVSFGNITIGNTTVSNDLTIGNDLVVADSITATSIAVNGTATIGTSGYTTYRSLGTNNIIHPPAYLDSINGVSLTALNKRTRESYATGDSTVSTWYARNATSAITWNSVCWSPELQLFCAVAGSGSNRVMTSPDGITWTARTITTNSWQSVCWSAELGIFCAVSSDGTYRVSTSSDGITWTDRTASDSSVWRSVIWVPELTLFVAIASSGTNRVMTSPDGTTWTNRSASEANSWQTVCWSPELQLLCAVSIDGTNRVMTSSDGITWTARTAAAANTWYGVCWSPELQLFCAVSHTGTSRIMTSSNGITWTGRTAPEANDWKSVVWSPQLSLFCAVAKSGTNRVMFSHDGINWKARAASATNQWYSICWSPELSMFCAVSNDGSARVMTSKYGVPTKYNSLLTAPSKIYIDPSSVNVGIGTTTPSYRLDVIDNARIGLASGNAQLQIGTVGTGITNEAGISYSGLTNDGTNYAVKQNSSGQTELNSSSGQVMLFNINDSEKMRIDGSGNVGVGTDNPSYKLEVYGGALSVHSGSDSLNAIMRLRTTDTNTRVIAMENDGDIFIGSLDSSAANLTLRSQENLFLQSGGSNTHMTMNDTGDVIFKNSSGPARFTIASNEETDNTSLFFSTPNSNPSIPGGAAAKTAIIAEALDYWSQSKLHICMDNSEGSSPGSHTVEASIANSITTFMNNGNVGIGTTSPGKKLDIRGGDFRIYPDSVSSSYYIQSSYNSGVETNFDIVGDSEILRIGSGNTPYIGTTTNHPFRLITNGNNRLYIEADGDIGINTSSITSGYKLDVNGSQIIRDNLYVQDNVGIGTGSPSSKLHVYDTVENGSTEIRISNGDVDGIPGSQDDGGAIIFDGAFKSDTSYSSASAEYAKIIGAKESGSNYTDGYVSFHTNRDQDRINGSSPLLSERMRITSQGSVLMGGASETTGFVLQVGTINSYSSLAYTAYLNGDGASSSDGTDTNQPASARFTGRVAVGTAVYITSDRRIKKNIQSIDDTKALDQLRQLNPCTYQYIDNVQRSNSTVIGYIAQEVADVIPEAVIKTDNDIVPSIYSQANCSIHSNKEIRFNYDTVSGDIALGDKIKFFLENEQEHIGNVSHLDNSSFTLSLETDITNTNATNGFLYGKQVNDFNRLNKSYIFTVATAALQELDRDHEATKAELATTKLELANATTKIDTLETRLASLEALVANLTNN